jgi:GTPase SAR1 family protein
MLTQYCFSKFDPTIKPTVGCDFNTKINMIDGSTVRLQLWDIAGQERFNSVSKMYVRGAFGAVLTRLPHRLLGRRLPHPRRDPQVEAHDRRKL